MVPDWSAVTLAFAAKYLGVFVGPGKKNMSWEAPIAKYLKRAAQWGKMGLGMHMTLRAYKIYVASVLMFVAQFEEAPEEFEDAEKEACR